MDVGRLTRRGIVQVAVLLAAASWLGSLVVLVVLTIAPTDEPKDAWAYWSTGVWLLVTLPVLVVLARWAFRPALRRIGPRGEPDEPEASDASDDDTPSRHHKGLHGELPPPTRW